MFWIGLLIFIVKVINELRKPTLPAGYHRNIDLEYEDAKKVMFGEMSKRQFIKNMNNGKYR